jgi:glycine cleavage system aminomethyltransferase T
VDSSIAEEHRAVRERAGLFDCTHMGVLEVSGADAAEFLNLATTNEIPSLKVGRARYGYILDAAGNVLDILNESLCLFTSGFSLPEVVGRLLYHGLLLI